MEYNMTGNKTYNIEYNICDDMKCNIIQYDTIWYNMIQYDTI